MSVVNITSGTIDAPAISIDTALTNTIVDIRTLPCNLTGYNIINPNTSDVYVKFLNSRASLSVLGTTAVAKTLLIPASGSVFFKGSKDKDKLQYFDTAMSIYCVTGLADNNTTAPTTEIRAEIFFDF